MHSESALPSRDSRLAVGGHNRKKTSRASPIDWRKIEHFAIRSHRIWIKNLYHLHSLFSESGHVKNKKFEIFFRFLGNAPIFQRIGSWAFCSQTYPVSSPFLAFKATFDQTGFLSRQRRTTWPYPLVNCYETVERSTLFNGKTHYFYGKTCKISMDGFCWEKHNRKTWFSQPDSFEFSVTFARFAFNLGGIPGNEDINYELVITVLSTRESVQVGDCRHQYPKITRNIQKPPTRLVQEWEPNQWVLECFGHSFLRNWLHPWRSMVYDVLDGRNPAPVGRW